MKSMKMLLLVLLSLPGLIFAKAEFSGELRNRFAYFINRDLYSPRSADYGIIDLRGRLGLKLSSKDDTFYLKYIMEVGNISWGEPAFGTALGTDGFNVETKNLYIGYKKNSLYGKVGLFHFSTPLGAEIDNDLAGIKLGYDGKLIHAEALYSLASAGANTNLNDNPSFFELDPSDNADMYYVMGGLHLTNTALKEKLSVWYLRYTDKNWGDTRALNYLGAYNELKLGVLSIDAGAVYNMGYVSITSNSNVNVGSLHAYAKAELELPQIAKVFVRVNMTTGNGGNNTNWTSIGQFQTIKGRGKLDTDLSILFGGSSFNQQSYFSSWIPTSNNKKNLTQGGYHNNDYGLFILEGGISHEFKSIGWTPKVVFGMATIMTPLTTTNSTRPFALGYELDFHNRFKLSKNTTLRLTAAGMLPGAALMYIFDDTYPGITIASLGSDMAIKIDGMLEIEI